MGNPNNGEKDKIHETEFKRFAAKRIILFTLLGVIAIWVVGIAIEYFEKPAGIQTARESEIHVAPEPTHNSPQPETLHRTGETASAHNLRKTRAIKRQPVLKNPKRVRPTIS